MTISTAPAKNRPTYVIQLRAEPRVDGIRALRHALKRLLRDYGLRAISVEEHEDLDA
jgi:hypothetical protein